MSSLIDDQPLAWLSEDNEENMNNYNNLQVSSIKWGLLNSRQSFNYKLNTDYLTISKSYNTRQPCQRLSIHHRAGKSRHICEPRKSPKHAGLLRFAGISPTLAAWSKVTIIHTPSTCFDRVRTGFRTHMGTTDPSGDNRPQANSAQ